MKYLILNGPNLNLLGQREPQKYGTMNLQDVERELKSEFGHLELEFIQDNSEGGLINALQSATSAYDGIVFNPGGYTHTSVAIADALATLSIPVVEVHISNILARELVRQVSLTAPYCKGVICGFGPEVYAMALTYLQRLLTRS